MKDYFYQEKNIIDLAIAEHFNPSDSYRHIEAARYAILPEGKRFRTIISSEIYQLLGGEKEKIKKGLVGLEFLHHATLVLDDLPCMDDSSLRKNKPTVHLQFGEANAVLASIYLLEEGRQLLDNVIRGHLKSPKSAQAADLLVNQSIRGLLEGQELDLKLDKNEDELMQSLLLKNGLFYLSVMFPVYMRGRDDLIKSFESVASDMSIAYQLYDDLRDLQSVVITGKDEGVDIEKNTSIYRYGVEEVKNKLKDKMENIRNNLSMVTGSNKLIEIVDYIFSTPS